VPIDSDALAKRHHFPVLLVNHFSHTSGWNADGEVVIAAKGIEPRLVLCNLHQNTLNGRMGSVDDTFN
jgi:hypothetical protein